MLSSQKQRTRDRSRSSQRSSFDLSSSRPAQVPEPAAGSKRLFSNRNSRAYDDASTENPQDEHEDSAVPGEVHSEKRHRSANWPLASSPANSSASRQPLKTRDAPNSPNHAKPNAHKRPSKFVEGSMNDRVSNKPHTSFLGTEDDTLLDNCAWDQATRVRPHSCLPHSNISSTGLSESSRHSSIFRFGKSIAASFNPSNWKMFNKQDRPVVEMETAQQKMLRERQAKAEKIYAELKETGHFPNMRAQSVEAFSSSKLPAKHDSGIAFKAEVPHSRTSIDSTRSLSKEDKRKGMVFLEPPSNIPAEYRGESPAISIFSTPSKTSLQHLKKSSLSNIKKKFYDNSNESSTDLTGLEHSARRIPSRKELQKQQKLVKRVSDLEGKLEAARRQLNEALAEPLPPREQYSRGGRKKFVPGAMPTLPSERLLSGYIQADNDEETEIGKAVDYDSSAGNHNTDESRGRTRVVHEPEMSPSQFYVANPSLSKEEAQARDRPMKSVENTGHVVKHEVYDSERPSSTTDVSVSTKVSKQSSLYQPGNDSQAEDSEDLLADESSSVPSASEPEDEVTPKPKRRKSTSITPKKETITKGNAASNRKPVANNTLKARKRKSLADDSGFYKPSKISTSEDGSESRPIKKQTLKRKSVGGSGKKTQDATTPVELAPPNRAPPPPPSLSQPVSANTTVEEPAAKSIKTSVSSSPSAQGKEAKVPVPPVRTISRKAVNSTAPTRLTKRKPHPRARQSASPPPSSATFELTLENHKTSRSTTFESGEIESENEATKSKRSSIDSSIPPMPKLPRTVRLPTGEIVDVKVKPPFSAPVPPPRTRSRSRGGSVVSTSRVVMKSGIANVEKVPKLTQIPNLSATEGIEQESDAVVKGRVTRSDTKTSFEWPADCF